MVTAQADLGLSSERVVPRSGSDRAEGAAAERPLVLDPERSVTRRRKRCPRPWTFQGVEYGCDRRTCPACGPRRKRLTARVLMIDARVDPPTHAITLTTRDPETPGEVYREASAAVWKRLRRQGWPARYFGAIEWTTGTARLSGGHRRMHGHYLTKGLDDDVRLIEGLVKQTWHESTENAGYGAWRVEVAKLIVPGAAIHYLNLHHRKAEQQPPDSWRGMLERASQGKHRYWSQPVGDLRELARLELRAEALAWSTSLDPDECKLLIDGDHADRRERRDEARRLQAELRELRCAGTPAAVVTVDAIEQLGLW